MLAGVRLARVVEGRRMGESGEPMGRVSVRRRVGVVATIAKRSTQERAEERTAAASRKTWAWSSVPRACRRE